MTCSVDDCKHKADYIDVLVQEGRMVYVCATHLSGSWNYRVPFRTDEEGSAYRSETRAFHLETN